MRAHPRAKRLEFVLNLAKQEETRLLQVLAEQQHKLSEELSQREQLERYHQEYQTQISAPGQTRLQAGLMHATLGFMQQIKQALQLQQERITLLHSQIEQATQAYLTQHGKVQAMDKMLTRLDQEYAVQQEKEQQKQTDEWVNRVASLRMLKTRK